MAAPQTWLCTKRIWGKCALGVGDSPEGEGARGEQGAHLPSWGGAERSLPRRWRGGTGSGRSAPAVPSQDEVPRQWQTPLKVLGRPAAVGLALGVSRESLA